MTIYLKKEKKKFLRILLTVIGFSFLLLSCGHKKSPTGGNKDTIKPKIISTEPISFSEIDKRIKIIFSKAIDKNSVFQGIKIYPPILKKKYNWLSNNILSIDFRETLFDSTNYYVNIFPSIQGIHQNNLDKYYLFTFYHGTMQHYTIYGNIFYEKKKDKNYPIIISLFSKDSLFVMKKIILNKSDFKIENLNKDKYILKCFIDKNSNAHLDLDKEPYDEITVTDTNRTDLKINLTYTDTISPVLTQITSLFDNRIAVKFSEDIASFDKFDILSNDSLKSHLEIQNYKLNRDSLIIITQPADSLNYLFKIFNIQDLKNNVTKFDSLNFKFNSKQDSLKPNIISIYPGNGRIISNVKPHIKIKFNELIKNLQIKLINDETANEIPLKSELNDKDEFVYLPQKKLELYTTYKIKLIFKDYSNNENQMTTKFIIKKRNE